MDNCRLESRKFEIIAALRDAIKENNYAAMESGSIKIECQVLKVDFRCVYFESFMSEINPGSEVNVTLNSKSAKYHFTFVMDESKFELLNEKYSWMLELPEVIEICQRRKQPRMSIPSFKNYMGDGRSNKGVLYCFDIKNLSKGGCTIISKPIYSGIKPSTPCIGETFNNLNFDFGILGGFRCNMTIVNKKIDRKGMLSFSCKFRKPNEKTQLAIDEVITKLLVQSKKTTSIGKA